MMTKAKPQTVKTLDPTSRHVRVSAERFAMLRPFVSREETRYYLNGVFVTPHPDKGVFMVATDGHRMGVIHDEDGESNGDWICPLSISGFRKAAARTRRQGFAGTVQFVGHAAYVLSDDFELHLSADTIGKYHMHAEYCPAIDGTFPDWRRIIPEIQGREGSSITVNTEYLSDFRTVGASRSSRLIEVAIGNATDPVIVRVPKVPEFFGILMPARGENMGTHPAWLSA